jgi:tetratricopeptide (TPR) repeat protein
VAHGPETVLIADFTNHTGDAIFDGTLEPVVKLALEDAGFITAYDRTQLRVLGAQPVSGRLDETAARQIAAGAGVGVVLSGSLDQQGSVFRLAIKATRAVTGNTVAAAEDTASNKAQLLFTATKLVTAMRKALGDDTSESVQRFAMETLTATSLEAIHDYAVAMEAVSNGKHEDALQSFSKAADIDPNFGLAYTGMAIASRNLGRAEDAEKYVKLALQHIDRMTEREKLRTRGSSYLVNGNHRKCIEEYSALVSRFPADATGHNNIAVCSEQLRDMTKAMEQVRQAIAILPKRSMYRNNLALYAAYGSDFATAEGEARKVQEMDPKYETGFMALAFAQLGQGKVVEAAETYRKLAQISPMGASKATSGLADVAIYEGRLRDAAQILEQGAAADLNAQNSDNAATKFVALAYTRLLQGDNKSAVAAAEKALDNGKSVKIRFLAGRILAAAGETKRAENLATELAMRLESEPQAYAKMIEGEVALRKGDPRRALTDFTEANNNADLWIGHFELGKAYLELNAFAEADSEFDRCLKRQGEALALFVDESPTFGYFPHTLYYLGRVREGLKSSGYGELYNKYLSIREKAGEDPLLVDVRKRLGK